MLGNARIVIALAFLAGPLGAGVLLFLNNIGMVRVALAPSFYTLALMILVAPVVEELAFRGAVLDIVQGVLRRLDQVEVGPVTIANVTTSAVFAACHLPYQSVALAASVFLPSLLLGRIREVTGKVLPCVLFHAWFNICFMALFTR